MRKDKHLPPAGATKNAKERGL